jgi:hypothetical protein
MAGARIHDYTHSHWKNDIDILVAGVGNLMSYIKIKNAGILRIRQVGIKNMPSSELPSIKVNQDGKDVYHENVVLDIDYYVIISKRG